MSNTRTNPEVQIAVDAQLQELFDQHLRLRLRLEDLADLEKLLLDEITLRVAGSAGCCEETRIRAHVSRAAERIEFESGIGREG